MAFVSINRTGLTTVWKHKLRSDKLFPASLATAFIPLLLQSAQ